ncbi:hypothetical protein HBB16_03960 [Pseudonocardia sp. MCCB 268]|nr:hypothetical protein [Pseudonocardia cytotoxica]
MFLAVSPAFPRTCVPSSGAGGSCSSPNCWPRWRASRFFRLLEVPGVGGGPAGEAADDTAAPGPGSGPADRGVPAEVGRVPSRW